MTLATGFEGLLFHQKLAVGAEGSVNHQTGKARIDPLRKLPGPFAVTKFL